MNVPFRVRPFGRTLVTLICVKVWSHGRPYPAYFLFMVSNRSMTSSCGVAPV